MSPELFYSTFSQQRTPGISGVYRRGFAAFRGLSIPYESGLEYEFIQCARRDDCITAIVAQPCVIPWIDGEGRTRRYIPDFAILIRTPAGDRATVVEVKPAARVRALDAEMIKKFRAGIRWGSVHQVGFALFTDATRKKVGNGFLTKPPLARANRGAFRESQALYRLSPTSGLFVHFEYILCSDFFTIYSDRLTIIAEQQRSINDKNDSLFSKFEEKLPTSHSIDVKETANVGIPAGERLTLSQLLLVCEKQTEMLVRKAERKTFRGLK